jgi:tetratricopeptide (TPR) repeat protein
VRNGSVRQGRRSARGLAAVLMIGLVVLAPACTKKSDASLASETLSKGIAAQSAGRLAEAAAAYRQVLTYDPNNRFAYYNLGLIDQTNGALASAESNYRLALDIDPEFLPAMFNLAITRHDLGDLEGSIDIYRQIIQLAPDNADAHLNLGFALLEKGKEKDGQSELATAVQLDPELANRVPTDTVAGGPEPGGDQTGGTASPEASPSP